MREIVQGISPPSSRKIFLLPNCAALLFCTQTEKIKFLKKFEKKMQKGRKERKMRINNAKSRKVV